MKLKSSFGGMRAWPGLRLALGFAGAALTLAAVAAADLSGYDGPWRGTGSPVYWGGERSRGFYRDCCGFGWSQLDPGQASMRQISPHLRAASDGYLLEEVGSPPPRPDYCEVVPLSSGGGVSYIPGRFFPHGPFALRGSHGSFHFHDRGAGSRFSYRSR